ncbi:hypothetical protein LG296_16730 [Ureibacillus chungkukjangi]|nr:hypothetical protein [Ureibacillus chungkukjangi]
MTCIPKEKSSQPPPDSLTNKKTNGGKRNRFSPLACAPGMRMNYRV